MDGCACPRPMPTTQTISLEWLTTGRIRKISFETPSQLLVSTMLFLIWRSIYTPCERLPLSFWFTPDLVQSSFEALSRKTTSGHTSGRWMILLLSTRTGSKPPNTWWFRKHVLLVYALMNLAILSLTGTITTIPTTTKIICGGMALVTGSSWHRVATTE